MRIIDVDNLKSELDRLGWTSDNGFDKRMYLDDIIDNIPTVAFNSRAEIVSDKELTFEEYLSEQLKDDEFKKEWDALEQEGDDNYEG